MPTQLRLADTTLPALIRGMAKTAASTVPELLESRVLSVIDLEFRKTVTQTVACEPHGICSAVGAAVWGGRGRLPREGTSRPAQFTGLTGDITEFPRQISVAVVSSLLPTDFVNRRAVIEDRLTTLFRQALLPYLFENEHCGHTTKCGAAPSDPFAA